MKKHPILFLVFFVGFLFSTVAANRTKYNFNSDWKLFIGDDSTAKNVQFKDSKWKSVNLPSAFNEEEAFKVPIAKLTDTIVWYRKTFEVPSIHKNQKIFIEFEGARQAAEVWVNGEWVGLYENGVMAFGFDLTNFIKFGGKSNVIAIRVDNSWKYKERATGSSFQWNDSNFNANYGGLTKNVFLHATDKLYQTLPLYNNLKTRGVYVYADNMDIKGKRAVLHVESEVKNEYSKPKVIRMNVIVRDNEKLLVREFQSDEITLQPGETKIISTSASMKNVQFWSWGYGYLYDVVTSITIGKTMVDLVSTRTGFRKTEFVNGVFKLNDRILQLKGYAQRTSNEWPGVGMSVPAWLSDYSNNLMVESNANLVRWMHITPWKQDVESCDRVGLLQAMPAGDSEKDVTGRRWEQRKEVMRDAIIYNRNNPSIIFYECGNAGISEAHMGEMLSIRNEYDSKGGRAIGSREMLDSKISEYGGEMLYINKSASKPVWAMEYARDEALRKYWDNESYPYHKQGDGPLYNNQNAASYNQNQDMFAMETVVRWYDYWRERPGTGKRVSSGGVSIIFSDSNTHCRGAENYRRSGKVDAMRIKKDAWWAHYVMWDGWVDVETIHSHIVGHWNYEVGVRKDVYVVSSGEKVELFLNKKSLGFGEQTSRFWFTFKNVTFQPGELRAVSYDKANKVVSEALCKTAGSPQSLKLNLIQSPDGFLADGSDMVLVELEVVDSKGQRCPLANDTVTMNLNGPAEYIGGIAQGENNFIRSMVLPVEAGVNRVLIRSTRIAGLVKLVATSGKLISDTLTVKSTSIDCKNGLSNTIAGAKLASRLTRGATPQGPSFVVSRIPVSVINATAGANEKDVIKSIDDNERTEWRNNGTRSTAWVKYELAREANLSEICIKLTGWRTRSYSLRILAENGDVLWEGATDRSLGYITLPLRKNISTQTVRIELKGAGSEKDEFASIVEVETNKNLDLFDKTSNKNDDPKDELRIVEIEFYESAE